MILSTDFVTLTQCETDIANFALSDSMSGLFRSSIRTTVATARRRLDEASGFLQRGNFAAVLDVLPDPASPFAAAWPLDVLEQAMLVRPLARFYSAWDRLDFKGASHVDLLPSLGMRVAGATRLRDTRTRWDKFVPSAAVRGWVQSLAEDLPDDARVRAGRPAAR